MSRRLTSTYLAALGFLLLLGVSDLSHAQMRTGSVGADSVQSSLFPALAYDSDVGFIFGGLYSRIDYRGNVRPFNNYIKSTAIVSTKGMVSFELEYDQTRSFNSDIRSTYTLYAYRFTHDYFFGIGNSTTYDEDLFDEEYYFYESKKINLAYEGRLPLHVNRRTGQRLDFLFGAGIKYENPSVKKPESRFNLDQPRGIKGGWINSFSGGVLWENRNSEFDPTSGNRFKLKVRLAPEFLFSKYGMTSIEGDFRQYFHLFNWVTIANRLQLHHTTGDVPYWELAALGNNETLRGYPLNRFMGQSSVAYSLEARKWILTFPRYAIKLGGHVFTDVGRVFTRQDDWSDLTSGYKQTIGVGGAISLFSPDFILRGELGLSEDTPRVYVGIGYTF